KLKKYCEKRGYPFAVISAVTGEGINKLKWEMGAIVRQMRAGSYEGPRPKKIKAAKPKPAAKSSPKTTAAVKSRKLAASKPRVIAPKKRVAEKREVKARAAANKARRTRATAA